MSFSVREGNFDVVVLAGPGSDHWSTVGARTISMICAEAGLQVGLYGGPQVIARGLIPMLPQSGAVVILEDFQKRIHRIRARAVVRLSAQAGLPNPFEGWWSEGLVPISTAIRLFRTSKVDWNPTVIIGTGNRALGFGADLLDSGVSEVHCVESHAQWGAKRYSGWEVARRRFEIGGGKVIEAKPIRLSKKAALLWEVRLQDRTGVRVLEAARLVSAGPFSDSTGMIEYPPGSFLFDLEQTAPLERKDDVDGWALEEERARLLATRLIKGLAVELSGDQKESVEKAQKRARSRLKRYFNHRQAPFTPSYQGKWIVSSDARSMRAFSGVPQEQHRSRPVASIECFEGISCNLCEEACPESAIKFGLDRSRILNESLCTACGLCIPACPSSIPVMIHEREQESMSKMTLAWRKKPEWKVGELATLVNRRGEHLGSSRVLSTKMEDAIQLVEVEVPTHIIWEARGLLKKRVPQEDTGIENFDRNAEILLDGDKRFVRGQIPITQALFEIGQSRPVDMLQCPDGSCGLCQIDVDGVKKAACQSEIHSKMAIVIDGFEAPSLSPAPLCVCLGITKEDLVAKIRQGKLKSPESVLAVLGVGEGKCHGQICMESFKRVIQEEGIDASHWADWRFPWTDWLVPQGPRD